MGTPSSKRFLRQQNGVIYEEAALATSAGPADANRIVATGPNGQIDASMIPATTSGTASTLTATADVDIAVGQFVTLFSSGGATTAGLAVATGPVTQAHGFALTGGTAGSTVSVGLYGLNPTVGATVGPIYLSTSPGSYTSTPPSSDGNIIQLLGSAITPTLLRVNLGQPIVLA